MPTDQQYKFPARIGRERRLFQHPQSESLIDQLRTICVRHKLP